MLLSIVLAEMQFWLPLLLGPGQFAHHHLRQHHNIHNLQVSQSLLPLTHPWDAFTERVHPDQLSSTND